MYLKKSRCVEESAVAAEAYDQVDLVAVVLRRLLVDLFGELAQRRFGALRRCHCCCCHRGAHRVVRLHQLVIILRLLHIHN